MVSHNCVVIFSKTSCPYCKMAKNVFSEIGAAYKVIELDEHRDGKLLQEALTHITGARTVSKWYNFKVLWRAQYCMFSYCTCFENMRFIGHRLQDWIVICLPFCGILSARNTRRRQKTPPTWNTPLLPHLSTRIILPMFLFSYAFLLLQFREILI